MTEHAGMWREAFTDPHGNRLPNALVTVLLDDEVTLATLYVDRDRSDTLTNPLPLEVEPGTAGIDEEANAIFFADPDTYVLLAELGGEERLRTQIAVALDPEDGAEAEPIAEAHVADTTGAHEASVIAFTATGDIEATNVQDAIVEVNNEGDAALLGHALSSTAHPASAITCDPVGDLTAVEVQDALAQIDARLQALEP